MSDDRTEAASVPPAASHPRWSMARTSVLLVVLGVSAMVLPGLLRDGLCGLVACADVTPDVAVGRAVGPELAVVMAAEAAEQLGSVRLFELGRAETEEERDVLNGDWIIQRVDDSTIEPVIPLGSQPEGFETLTEMTTEPVEGTWVIDASFGCASKLVRFSPEELTPGFVTDGDDPVQVSEFTDTASSELRCAQAAPSWQRWLFVLGALSASIGAVLGIVVVFRRPVHVDPEWYDPDQEPI